MNNINIDEFRKYLDSVRYPASREMMLDAARQNGAPGDVLAVMKVLPDREYAGSDEASQELNSIILTQRETGPR